MQINLTMKEMTLLPLTIILLILFAGSNSYGQKRDTIHSRFDVTLVEAHKGTIEIDTRLLDSYLPPPDNTRNFYLESSRIFRELNVDFTDSRIIEAAVQNKVPLMGGPMLGNLKEDGVTIWIRPSTKTPITIQVTTPGRKEEKRFEIEPVVPGKEQRIKVNGLSPSTRYDYVVMSNKAIMARGAFTTAPKAGAKSQVRLAFGSCFHKIGLHNPNLIHSILDRKPLAMMLLGDIAADDRENHFNLHRSDYLLRDVSEPWKKLTASVPIYAGWDDHDYLNNDLSGIPDRISREDIRELRALWRQNWNNPPYNAEGNYFNTRVGPVELIMLDTRSCRNNEEKGEYGSYLGREQLSWLKSTLVKSKAPFKVISSGTMWSDYITNGKDSWGIWDRQAREEIFNLIETENIAGVLLISGDRHGARGFTIPRPSGYKLYEFEAASLGGVPGPAAMSNDTANQIFGYDGNGFKAFGEFTFMTEESKPRVTFRLIDEFGNILEEHSLSYNELLPRKN